MNGKHRCFNSLCQDLYLVHDAEEHAGEFAYTRLCTENAEEYL